MVMCQARTPDLLWKSRGVGVRNAGGNLQGNLPHATTLHVVKFRARRMQVEPLSAYQVVHSQTPEIYIAGGYFLFMLNLVV